MSRTVDAILALHHDKPNLAQFDVYICNECQKTQPCPTLLAIGLERYRPAWERARREVRARREAYENTYHWISETEAVR